MGVRWPLGLGGAAALCIALAGCTLSRPHYIAPDVHVGEPAFVRAMEAHTLSGLVDGNRVDLLLNGDEIFPAMLAAIHQARTTITFANFIYEDGAIADEMAEALAERCRAGVGVNVLVDAVGSSHMPKPLQKLLRPGGQALCSCGLAVDQTADERPAASDLRRNLAAYRADAAMRCA